MVEIPLQTKGFSLALCRYVTCLLCLPFSTGTFLASAGDGKPLFLLLVANVIHHPQLVEHELIHAGVGLASFPLPRLSCVGLELRLAIILILSCTDSAVYIWKLNEVSSGGNLLGDASVSNKENWTVVKMLR